MRLRPELNEAEEGDLRDAYTFVFSSLSGQKVLADLAHWCGMLRPSFVPGDPHTTSFNEGMRNTLLMILSMAGRLNPEDCEVLWKSLTKGQ